MNEDKSTINIQRRNFIKLSLLSIGAFMLGKISAPFLNDKAINNLAQVGSVSPPPTPGGVMGSAASPTEVSLSWDPSVTNTGIANYKVYRSQAIQTTPPPQPTPSPVPSPTPTPLPPIRGKRLILSDTTDGPNWHVSNALLSYGYRSLDSTGALPGPTFRQFGSYRDILGWRTKGGDWRDASNVDAGSNNYATANVTKAGIQGIVFNVTPIVQRHLADQNTGFHMRMISPGTSAYFSSREIPDASLRPKLIIVTDQGIYDCPCLADTYVSASSTASLGMQTRFNTPAMLRFDYSLVRGNVSSASMTLTTQTVYGATPQTYAVNFLDMPPLITAPAEEFPELVNKGIAATVATDEDLRNHPDVIWMPDFSSDASLKADMLVAYTSQGAPGEHFTFPETGSKALRATAPQNTEGTINAHKWFQPKSMKRPDYNSSARPSDYKPDGSTWLRDYGAGQGYDSLKMRYMFRITESVPVYMRELGVKLPGINSTYDWNTNAETDPQPGYGQNFYSMLEHGRFVQGKYARLYFYWYAPDNPYTGGNPDGIRGASRFTDLVMEVGRLYSIEMQITVNTRSANGLSWNRDGILKLLVDGVPVYYVTDVLFRTNPNVQIHEMWMLIYHGGNRTYFAGPAKYEIGGVVVSKGTQDIGPAKRI